MDVELNEDNLREWEKNHKGSERYVQDNFPRDPKFHSSSTLNAQARSSEPLDSSTQV